MSFKMRQCVSSLTNMFQKCSLFEKTKRTNVTFPLKQQNNLLIETEELNSFIKSGKEYLIFDTSSYNIKSHENENNTQEYTDIEKIKGTINFDAEITKHENPKLCHLFPTEEQFFSYLKKLLILNETNINSFDNIPIIFYEKSEIFLAPRTWFLFKLFGFTNLKILNGGLNKWILEKKEVMKINSHSDISKIKPEKIKKIEEIINKHIKKNKKKIINNLKNNIYHYIDIKKLIQSKQKQELNNFIIVDTRSHESYVTLAKVPDKGKENGEKFVPNSLPFSINIPYTHFLCFYDGTIKNEKTYEETLNYVTFKKISELQRKVDKYNLLNKEKIIVSICNKGITASILLFVLHLLNKPFSNLILYPGSMVEYKIKEYEL